MTSTDLFLKRPLLGGRVNFPVMLAPMVGLSHVALRLLVRRYLPAGAVTIWPTEMLSSWRLPREIVGRTPETLRAADEDGLVPQILGNEEGAIRESVRLLVDWGAEGIDINMGCPVRKALKHNYGVALMGDSDYAAEVVAMARRGTELPISVKLRAGLQNDPDYLVRFTRGLEASGASWITLHPRLAQAKRRGQADWAQIGFVRDQLGIPVIGNGDVQCVDDVFELAKVSACDAVMVGRALAARPWLLWQVGERLGFPAPAAFPGGQAPFTPAEEGAEYGRALGTLIDGLEHYFPYADGGAKRLQFHVRMTAGWLQWGQALYSEVSRSPSYGDLRIRIAEFFTSSQVMYPRTNLRE